MSGNPVGVDNTFRRKFDKEEYLERARQRGREEKEEARKGKDKGPPVQRQPLKHRDYEVDLESRLGKTQVVTPIAPLSQQAGYYCSVCECVGKDSANYLDHINGKKHQRALGMSVRVERASLEQVQKMFESLKKRKDPSSFSEQAIMSKTKKPALRKGTIPDGDSEERYNPPASSTGPSRRKSPSKKAASRKSIWDELSDEELASFPSTGPSRQKAPSKKAASRKSIWDELSDEELASFLLGIKEKGKEQSSKKQAAEPEFEEEECDEESDEEMAETEEPTIDLMLITNDNYALLRHVNQYEKPNSSTDARFHTRFQQEVFAQLYSQHRQFADHKHVDWAHLNSLDKYEGAYRLFQAVGLHDIVALRCDYNEEIIRQFYATVHVSASFDHLIWMTGTQRYQAFKVDFERALRTYMGTQERIEDKEALRVPAWCQFYDQSVNFVPGKIGGLLSLPSLINRIINHTFFPKSGNFDAIRGHAWNIIDNIMHGRKFDVVDLIIREISSSKNDRVKRIYFAPYIMALILRVTRFRGGQLEVHKAYKPREGAQVPAAVPPPASDVPSQSPATPADQVSLSQMLSVVMEIRDSQQKLEQNQQRLEEAQTETNNRIAALTKQIHTLERARYGRR